MPALPVRWSKGKKGAAPALGDSRAHPIRPPRRTPVREGQGAPTLKSAA